MKTQTTNPAPVWRLLEPGEIIQEGDQVYQAVEMFWLEANRWIGTNAGPYPVRRRLEPDPVKAELLAALKHIHNKARTIQAWIVEGQRPNVIGELESLAMVAEAARAKSTA